MRNGRWTARPVLIVHEDRQLRDAVVSALAPLGYEIQVVGTAAEGLAAARRERPSLVVLDIRLPDLSGYEVCRDLREQFGDELAIIFASGYRTDDCDRAAGFIVGADDYIVKPFSVAEVSARVRRAVERSSQRKPAPAAVLTDREREVLRLLADGMSQPRIAETLVISPNTVATHIQRILLKLDLHSRAEAVAFAHRHGL